VVVECDNQTVTDIISYSLRKRLEELGWSQHEISRRTGDAHMSVVNCVNGLHTPNAALLWRISKAMGLPIESCFRRPRGRWRRPT